MTEAWIDVSKKSETFPKYIQDALNNDQTNCALFLIEKCKKSSVFQAEEFLFDAVVCNTTTVVKALLLEIPDVSLILENRSRSPLYYAVQNKNYQVCSLLLKKGARLDLTSYEKDHKGHSGFKVGDRIRGLLKKYE